MASSPSKKASPISFALFSMTAATLLGDEPPTSDACSSDCSTSSSKVSLTCLFPFMGADARGNQNHGFNMPSLYTSTVCACRARLCGRWGCSL